MHRNDIICICRKIWKFKQSLKVTGEGVNAVKKKVGLYLQKTHISSATHRPLFKCASKLNLRYCTSLDLLSIRHADPER